jgi:GntR family transcriptional regulator
MVEYVPVQLMGITIDPRAMISIDTDLFDMLNSHLEGCVAKTVTDLAAALVDEEHAPLLGVPVGEPVLKTEQITLNAYDEPLAYGTTLQRTDRVRMRIVR